MMKSKKRDREDSSPPKRSYPYMGENKVTGTIVLFTRPNTGIAVYDPPGDMFGRPVKVGTFFPFVRESQYEKYDGEITLRN